MPLFAEAAISTASPLRGTGPFVAAVTLNAPPGAAAVADVLGCDWSVPIAWVLGSGVPASVCSVLAAGECSRAVIADVEAPAASAASAAALVFSGLPAVEGCCGRPSWVAPAGALVADGSFVPDVVVVAVAEPSVAAVVADGFPGVAFGVTGAVAATVLANAAAFAGVACWITGALTAPLAATEIAVFVVAEAVVVAVAVAEAEAEAVAVEGVVAAAASVAAVFESVLIWADEAACAEIARVLAAIAAAAIASGAVELPDGVAAGTFVGAVVTGIATATGFGVVAVRAACWARMVRSAVDVSALAGLSVDFAGSAFADFAWDGGVAPVLVGPPALALLTLLSEGGPALALLLGSLLAA
ncbi:MAG: hypothetical protein ACLQDM_32755 [Bradyrhizobium sp.]